jgi:hypothetical protein
VDLLIEQAVLVELKAVRALDFGKPRRKIKRIVSAL